MVLAVAFKQPGADADDHHRDQRLHQRRGKRQHDAAPRGLLVGDEIGRDHRLAVAGAGGVEDAVGKGDRRAASRPPSRRIWRRGWSRTSRDRIPTALPAASRRCRRPAARRRLPAAGHRTDSARAMACSAPSTTTTTASTGDAGRRARTREAARLIHGQSTVILLANIMPKLEPPLGKILLAELLRAGGAVVRPLELHLAIGGRADQFDRILVGIFEVDEEGAIEHFEHELLGLERRLQRQGEVQRQQASPCIRGSSRPAPGTSASCRRPWRR